MTTIQCPYCLREDFQSERGLQQHLTKNQRCSVAHEAAVSLNPAKRVRKAEAIAQDVLAEFSYRIKWKVHEALKLHDADARRKASGNVVVDKSELLVSDSGLAQDTEVPVRVLRSSRNLDQTETPFPDQDHADDEGPFDAFSTSEDNDSEQLEEASTNDNEETVFNTRIRDQFKENCAPDRFFLPFLSSEVTGVKLMDVIRTTKGPLNAYKAIMSWHLRERGLILDHQGLGHAVQDQYIGRNTLMKRLIRRYSMTEKGPVVHTIKLPSCGDTVKIPCFKAEDCIEQLLTNPRLVPEDYQFFDDDPLAPPPEDLDYIGDCITGDAYIATHRELIKEPNHQLMGVIFYIDGAVTGQFAHLPVTAVKMSLTIFTREARTKDHMWATLGYIPQIRHAEGRGKKLYVDSGHLEAEDIDIFDGEGEGEEMEGSDQEDEFTDIKAQDFHKMLSVILESYVEIERTGFVWDLVYKKRLYPDIHYHLFTNYVRCDTEEGDTLCGKYLSRGKHVKQLCRYCEVPTDQTDDPRANYPLKTQTKIEKLINQRKLDQLKSMSQHCLKNAWYDLRFNLANDRGIHGACPSEKLHAVQLGNFKYTRDVFFKEHVGAQAELGQEINGLARVFGKLLSRQADRTLPNTNFAKGIMDGKLMAKDHRGVLLILAAVLRSSAGRTLLGGKRRFRNEHKKDDWLLLVELLLEWEAYLCQPTMKKKHVKRLEKKSRYIMYIMKFVAQRTKGMGLKIMKFHAIIHMMGDILLYGVPLEFDTAANESHHKPAKYGAKLTQRNEDTFDMQVATRMFEFRILDLALEEVQHDVRIFDYFAGVTDSSGSESELSDEDRRRQSDSDKSRWGSDQTQLEIVTDDARIRVFVDEKSNENSFEMISRSKHADKTALSVDLIDFLIDLQDKVSDYIPEDSLPIFTRHKRGAQIFHGHPNYRGQGPWKDWVVVDWGEHGDSPCHISCFVVLQGLPERGAEVINHGGIQVKDGVYAVVESTELETDETELKRSDLFVPWLKLVGGLDEDGNVASRQFYLANTEAFLWPCACIPDIGGPPNRYFMVKSRTEWPKEFIKFLESPHELDDFDDLEE